MDCMCIVDCGKVLEAVSMIDNKTGRHRGFGYVIFMDEDGVEKVSGAFDEDLKARHFVKL